MITPGPAQDLSTLQPPQRKRAVRRGLAEERYAASAIRGYHRDLAEWRSLAARMQTMAWKAQGDASRQALCAKADELAAEVRVRLDHLEAMRAELPPEIANHSRVIDTQRAFESLERQLRRCQGIAKDRAGEGGRVVPLPDVF